MSTRRNMYNAAISLFSRDRYATCTQAVHHLQDVFLCSEEEARKIVERVKLEEDIHGLDQMHEVRSVLNQLLNLVIPID